MKSQSSKNIYEKARTIAKEHDKRLKSRESAEELLHINHDRLGDIENGETIPRDDEVVSMAVTYNCPELYNYYCTNECQIGSRHLAMLDNIEDLGKTDLAVLTLQFRNALKDASSISDVLERIADNGKINSDEEESFETVLVTLQKLEKRIKALQLWSLKENGRTENS